MTEGSGKWEGREEGKADSLIRLSHTNVFFLFVFQTMATAPRDAEKISQLHGRFGSTVVH